MTVVRAQDSPQDNALQSEPERPKILPDRRWEENWSVLADPRIKREPMDGIKYMPFLRGHPKTYLSLGFNLRQRLEIDHAPFFGTVPGLDGAWLLSRLEAHADLRLGGHVQVFTQLQSELAPGKNLRTPIDQDPLDLEQAFIGLTEPLKGGTLTLRVGRQLVPIDLQRFVSLREGPNLRQSYDAAYADYQRGDWRITGGYTRPVQSRDLRPFNEYSDSHLTLSGILIRRRLFGSTQLSADYMRYSCDAAVFPNVSGDERRDIVDLRFSGAANGFDWDLEAMNQTGRIGVQIIEAWAVAALAGYIFPDVGWTPRLGLSIDVASGDRNPHDNKLETFNPLFPNGYYLAEYTGYPNLIHVKPTATVHPKRAVKLMAAIAGQWRETTADAIYSFPSFPLVGTAGRPGRYTGTYGEFRGEWTVTPHYSVTVDAVRYVIGNPLREAGGHDSNYLGVELRYGW